MMIEANGMLNLVQGLTSTLLIATAVYAFCQRVNFPFTVALVLTGLGMANLDKIGLPDIGQVLTLEMTPELILFVFLPTLIFESAYNLDAQQLKKNLLPVLTLAVPGLLLSTGIIGTIIWLVSPFDFAVSLLLGAILSATDPVAVIALFKQLGAPKKLTVLVEGESLFNDATAVVTAKIILGAILAGTIGFHDVSHGAGHFLWEFLGGIIVGWILGRIVAWVIGLVTSDISIEISLSMVLAYASFIIAQEVLHVSGIMATVAAGVTLGGWGRAKISPAVAHFLGEYWEYLAFIANALIFLLVGLSIDLATFTPMMLGLLSVVIFAMLISRGIVVYGLLPMIARLPNAPNISRPYQHVMYWGGLRGAIALAIVLGLENFMYKNQFIILVSGAVLFTLIIQGLSIEKLVRWLGLDIPPLADRLAKIEGQYNAKQYALARLPELSRGGLFSARVAKTLATELEQDLLVIKNKQNHLTQQQLSDREKFKLALLRNFAAIKTYFYHLYSHGHYTETTYRHLNYQLDVQTDHIRYWDILTDNYQPYIYKRSYLHKFYQAIEKLPLLKPWALRGYAKEACQNYELIWGQHQGAVFILEHMQKSADTLGKVIHFFDSWRHQTREQLDEIAEAFPEFVTHTQKRLAQRLVLQAEIDMISEQAHAGLIPSGVAESIQADLEHQALRMREEHAVSLDVDPEALLRKVPFFIDLPEYEFKKILTILNERIFQTKEDIIQEGDTGTSMFLILRGVIRVTKLIDGVTTPLATLIAGDFFGEMALLHAEPRSATCTSMTPSVLYELKRKDCETIVQTCPALKAAMEQTDRERRG